MRRVLILSDGWKRLTTYPWTSGAQKYIQETNADITIDQFNCWGDWSLDDDFNRGEYEIFQVPDLSAYDGIVIDANNITHTRVLNRLLDGIRASGVPAVSLCNDIPGMYYAGINGRKAVTELIRHLYTKHGCRSFFCAAGPRGNYENEERVSAFQESMRSLGLPDYADQVMYSDFDANGGRECMKYILDQHIPIPDAIVCANDNIAVGLIGEAEQHGYHVPRDFLVTGFDNFDKAAWFEPQLTTAALEREPIGALSIQILEKIWKGEPCPRYSYTTAPLIFTESCGCPNTGTIDYRGYVRDQVMGIIRNQDNDTEIAKLESDLAKTDHTLSFARRVAREYAAMDCDGCAVFMDSRILDPDPDDLAIKPADTWQPGRIRACAIMGRHPASHMGETIEEFLQNRSDDDRGEVYYHIPLHIGSAAAGVVIFRNPRFLSVHFDIFEIQETILFVLQSQYQNARLTAALNALRRIYDRDPMTGVYNRTAFDQRLVPLYQEWVQEGRTTAVIFTDVDHFKEINDSRGHAYGDEVLKSVAHALQQYLPEQGFVCRYGGDEFLAVFPYENRQDVEDYVNQVSDVMSADGIQLSAGIHTAEGKDLEANVQAADREMYRVKKQHHRTQPPVKVPTE